MRKYNLGLEAIGFQSDDIFEKITNLFIVLREKNYEDLNTVVQIQEVVKHRFGIPIELSFKSPKKLSPTLGSASTTIPLLHMNNIFIDQKFKQKINDYLDHADLQIFDDVNIVNLEKAKITGLNLQAPYKIKMLKRYKSVLTPDEETAVFLHEIGHIFTYFENMTATVTTNLILLGVANLATGTKTSDEKRFIFKKYCEKLSLDNKVFDRLENIKSAQEVSIVYLSNIVKLNKSATASSRYDRTAAEQSADQFVSRLGGGRQLISAISKITRLNGGSVTTQQTVLFDAISLLTVFFSIVELSNLSFSFGGLVKIVTSIFLCYQTARYVSTNSVFARHDQIKVRLMRIRNDLVTLIKETDDDDIKKIAIIDIEYFDEIIQTVTSYSSLISTVIDYVFKNKQYEAYKLQRDLEDLAFNDLFIKSEKLRLI